MMDSSFRKSNIYNPENINCPLCEEINHTRMNSIQYFSKVPQSIGEGYYKKIYIKSSMDITIADMTFYNDITLGGSADNSLYYLAFCLGENHEWKEERNKKEYEVKRGEAYLYKGGDQDYTICNFSSGQHFSGLGIHFNSQLMETVFEHLGKKKSCICKSKSHSLFYKNRFSIQLKIILQDIINCPYHDQILRIYLEGKILELIAVYINEIIFENSEGRVGTKLSSSDIKALQKAKSIIEENLTTPPTITKLARLVCLNEYKLKRGFKEMFGMPVHAYVIDKRLEMAKYLIEKKKLNVTQVAVNIGYSDASHFSEKFRKKYGINPSEYIKTI